MFYNFNPLHNKNKVLTCQQQPRIKAANVETIFLLVLSKSAKPLNDLVNQLRVNQNNTTSNWFAKSCTTAICSGFEK